MSLDLVSRLLSSAALELFPNRKAPADLRNKVTTRPLVI
jgi:hypothetical protein